MFKPQEISATEARKYFSQIINKVLFSSKSFTVKTYRRPAVRVVKEEYIAALEQVLGKKTVGQIMQISGNDNMREAEKVQEIKKIFQRRLSGGPRPQTQSSVAARPNPPLADASPKRAPVAVDSQSAQLTTKPSTERGSYNPTTKANPPKPVSPRPTSPASELAGGRAISPPDSLRRTSERAGNPNPKPQKKQKTKRVLLLSNGKNYK